MSNTNIELRKTFLSTASDDIYVRQTMKSEKRCEQYTLFIEPRLLSELFSPEDYRVKDRLDMLHRMGGISHVLDGLKVWHESGLQQSEICQQRKKKYGVNSQNAHALKQLLLSITRQLRNPLIQYLLLLQLTILLLEYCTQQSPEFLNLLLSIFLIFVIVIVRSLMDRLVQTQMYKRLKQDSENTVTVRRGGGNTEIRETEVLVGDIMILNRKDIVTVDGILLKNTKNFKVNENFTIRTDDEVVKNNAWDNSPNSDPFILAGSEVISGSGEMLVCTVGQNCSFRVVTKLQVYRDSKSKFLSKLINNLHRFNRITRNILLLIVLIQVTILMIKLSPLQWSDVRVILMSVSQTVGMLLLVDRQNISDFIYCFVQNNCITNTFKILRKQVVQEIMTIDILLVEQDLLRIESGYNNRQQKFYYTLLQQQTLQRLSSALSLKLLTKKSYSKTQQYKLKQVYNVNKYLMSQRDIRDLKNCKYIADCSVQGVVESIMGTFTTFGYRIGVATVELEGELNCMMVTTDAAPQEVVQNSWVRISSKNFEKGLEELMLVATRMHLMKGAYGLVIVNNTIVLALGYIFLRGLGLWQVFLVCLIENITLMNINKYLSDAEITKIWSLSSIQNVITFFNITTGVFYFYTFLKLTRSNNQFIFLLVNSLLRGLYVLGYGSYMPQQRSKFLRRNYFAIFLLLLLNYVYSWLRPRDEFDLVNGYDSEGTKEEVMLVVMVGFLQGLHFIQKKLTTGLSALR